MLLANSAIYIFLKRTIAGRFLSECLRVYVSFWLSIYAQLRTEIYASDGDYDQSDTDQSQLLDLFEPMLSGNVNTACW